MSGCEFDRLLEKLLLSKKLTLASLQRALRYDGPSRRARICTTRSSSHFISAFAASLSFSSSLPRPLTNAAAFLVCVVKQTIVSCQRRVAMERHVGPHCCNRAGGKAAAGDVGRKPNQDQNDGVGAVAVTTPTTKQQKQRQEEKEEEEE